MLKKYNFSASAAPLPEEVVEKARAALSDYNGMGISVMSLPQNSEAYGQLLASAERNLRKLINIPQNYKILFMQGNATTQYSAIPLNLLSEHKYADYIISGQYSKNAASEAKKYGDISIASTSAGAMPPYSVVPRLMKSDFRPDADYVYMRYDNMIHGTKFNYIPDTGNIPLVADMSSCFLSEPIDITKFALVFASSEGNLFSPGLTVVILRDDIIGKANPMAPKALNYKLTLEELSSDNTPPVWSIFLANLNFEWLLENGGLEEVKRRNDRKAGLLYDFLDGHDFYTAPVDKSCRSTTHIIFVTGDAGLDGKFLRDAEAEGLLNLRGNNSLGGMCASIYNTMPLEGVEKLIEFMDRFSQINYKSGTK